MGKKYIIELDDKPFRKENGDFLYRGKGFNSLVFDLTGISKLTPYTEPDLDAIRNEAYEKGVQDTKQHWVDAPRSCAYKLGYENGLNDAWECARKLVLDTNHGGLTKYEIEEIFGVDEEQTIINYSASEAIEKIRQYEQRQEEQIQVGDEVKNTQTDARFIVTHMWVNNSGEKGVSGFNYECSAFSTALDLVRKTGRHFPEIAEVMQKMKEK